LEQGQVRVAVPYVTSVPGSTITSAWANGNIRDQVVTPFASNSARSAVVSAPPEGMVSYLADTNRLDFFDATTWRPVVGAAAKVTRNSNQVITTGTLTAIQWASSVYDSHSMWSGVNPTRLTAPWTGYYGVSATANWETTSGGKERRAGLYVVGNAEDATIYWSESALTGVGDFRQNPSSAGVKLTAGDYVELKVFHDAGADRNISVTLTNMKMVYLGVST
jgi:hypothetical protein